MNSLGLSLAKHLKEFRNKRNETQEWLSILLGFSRHTINRWEKNGAGTATLNQTEEISEKLQIPIKELLGLEEQKSPYEIVKLPTGQLDLLRGFLEHQAEAKLPEDIQDKLLQLTITERERLFDLIRGIILLDDETKHSLLYQVRILGSSRKQKNKAIK